MDVLDIPCTVCGCVCDDLRVTVEENRLVDVANACPLAMPWFQSFNGGGQSSSSVATVDGVPVDRSIAVDRAAAILGESRNPLVWGLSCGSTEGQRAAVALADLLGANVDTTASVCHGPSITAIQSAGESTCTLGEVRNRADLVVYWGSNPVVSHPRHIERYVAASDRRIVVVGSDRHETADLADLFVAVEPGRDFEAIWTLRHLVAGSLPEPSVTTGARLDDLRHLAETMTSCRYGALFFGLDLAQSDLGYLAVEGLLRLVAELNRRTRFTARRMRVPGDVTGADNVLCWQTGYPFAVNLSRGYPRHDPVEFGADGLLARGDVDACLLYGTEVVHLLSDAAREWLSRIPVITLDHENRTSALQANVAFTTAVDGVHVPGTVYRMDDVPLATRPFLESPSPSDAEVLNDVRRRVESHSSRR